MRHPAPSVLWGRGLGDWEGASQKCQGRTRLKPGGVQGGRELSESWACSGRGVFPLEGGSRGGGDAGTVGGLLPTLSPDHCQVAISAHGS